ncbi:helix-turn-helix domain-containing protein [Streptomyces sp. NPDC049916]|uniref:AraC-like ligand-binding domain-containing protein n=1 Tax=Streptomyces sp. NPDC049916 TaxID=3155156 RepID=UPI00341628CF
MDGFSTAGVAAGERLDFWREVSSNLWVPYDLSCERESESGFKAHVGIAEFGPVQAALMTSTQHTVHRTPKLIRQADPEVFKLGCLERGQARISQGGRQAEFGVGDLVLFDPSRPYLAGFRGDNPVSRLLLLRFPRSSLPIPLRDLRDLSATPLPGGRGIGALTSQFMIQLSRRLGELRPCDTARLATLTLDLLIVALADAMEEQGSVPPHTRNRVLVTRIFAFIRDNLSNPGLKPEMIAAAHNISLRYLHRLFQQEGHTVACWIREQRLEQSKRGLADPKLLAQPIETIAARWGFSSPAYFSQLFRGTYGITPSTFRHEQATRTVRAH